LFNPTQQPPAPSQDPTRVASAFIIHSIKSSASSSFPSFPSLRRETALDILEHSAAESERARRGLRLKWNPMLFIPVFAAAGGKL
jgi:hypothetical protein